MAGGTWNKLTGKERPGTYINFRTTEQNIVGISERGTVIMPLLGHNYGPAGEFFTIENSSPDAQYAKLGYSVYEAPLLLVKEALKCAKKVILYIPTQGERAQGSVALPIPETEVSHAVSEAAAANLGVKPDMTGCTINFDPDTRALALSLTGPLSGVQNTGIFVTMQALINDGCAITIDGTNITGLADFQATASYAQLAAITQGGSVTFEATVSKGGVSEEYTILIDYPVAGARAARAAVGNILTGKAKYGGERGNALSFDCAANEDTGYDVTIYLENSAVELFEGLETIGDLIRAGSDWMNFTGDEATPLSDFSAISLAGGTNGTTATIDMTKFLDASESIEWTTMAFPVNSKENASLLTAAVSKIKYLREDAGKYRKLVVANYSPDYEGVINVCNGYVLSDGSTLDAVKATAWVAGADAGADCVTSNTYKVVEDAADIVGLLTHTEAVAAIKAGKFFFSFNEKQEVVVEYDINSLTTYGDGKKAKSWRKNRVLRVLDSFGESCQNNFTPNKFDNDDDGWDIMEGIGKTILKLYGLKSEGGVGAIRNIDYDNDFKVDRELSHGDEVYFNVGIQPVDSAEKLFFTITTR